MVRLASALLLRASLLLLKSEKEEEEEEEKGKVSNQKRYIPSIDERCLLLSFISKTFLSLEQSCFDHSIRFFSNRPCFA
jgi:hypothetical protein